MPYSWESNASTCRHIQRAASWFIALVLLLLAVPAAPAQRLDLAPFQDSIQRIRDVDQLRVMLARRSSRDAEKSPVALTERGFVALRLWDLTSQWSHSRLAAESFKRALKQNPDYGWAHYGLGLAYVNGPDAHPEKAGWRAAFILDDVVDNITGNDLRSRAHREFMKAVTAEPPIARAADQLAENAVLKNKRKTLDETRTALETRVAVVSDDAASWFALARVQTELGDLTNATNAMDHALAAGINSENTAHARAALLLRLHGREEAGAKAWFEGLNALSTDESEVYFNDIEALLSKEEHEAWKSMDLGARTDFLRTFWDTRAALGGVTPTERLAEHYRRLAFARRMYFRESKWGAPLPNELRFQMFSQRSDYDDRGVIYIRHGAPASRIVAGNMPGYDTWIYPGLNGDIRYFHFFLVTATHGYSLMHKLPCEPQWLEDRVSIDTRYYSLARRCDQLNQNSLSADMRQIAFEGLATDSDRPNFTKELPFYFDLYTFRATEGRTNVLAAVAVPRDKLNLTDVAANSAYRIDLSLILVDTLSRKVIREDDSLWVRSPRAIADGDMLRLHVEVAVPPSRTTIQRLIVSDPTEAGVGQLYGGPFPVPDYTGSKLMLSDVVLAEPGVAGRYHRGDVALALVPTGYFKGGSFNVFYEIYNIAENARYSTEIEIEPIRKATGEKLKGFLGSGRNPIKLRFESVATHVRNATLQELRRVDAPLGAGSYRMRVVVKNLENGETSKNERTFVIP